MTAEPRVSDDWHARAGEAVLRDLGAAADGLSEAETRRRLAEHGPNALPAAAGRTLLQRIVGQFNNVLIYVLIGCGAVTAALGHWTDTAVILAVVVLNADHRLLAGRAGGGRAAGGARDALRRRAGAAQRAAPHDPGAGSRSRRHRPARGRRSRACRPAPRRDARPAGAGSRADRRIGAGDKDVAPVAAEASLGDRTSMAYSGTLVTSGRAVGVVVATGRRPRSAGSARMLGEIEELTTPLLRQMDRFARR